MKKRTSTLGFTLIELMVTVALMGLVAMGMLGAMEGQKAVYISNERTLETQEDARLVLDLVAFDARMETGRASCRERV